MENKIRPIVFYHRVDFDGVCSAAICLAAVAAVPNDCEIYGIDHGERFPWEHIGPFEQKRKVYMVDFSLPREEMLKLNEMSDLVWIDHHKTSIEAIEGTDIKGVREIGKAACELAWTYFFNDNVPTAVEYLGAYDVWRGHGNDFWNDTIVPFQLGLSIDDGIDSPLYSLWNTFFFGSGAVISTIRRNGIVIQKYLEHKNAIFAKEGAFETTFNGYRCIALCTGLHGSEAIRSEYDRERHDLMLLFRFRSDKKWTVSIYSEKPEIDCGEIARQFEGGGGHKGAAGFETKELPFFVK